MYVPLIILMKLDVKNRGSSAPMIYRAQYVTGESYIAVMSCRVYVKPLDVY